LVVLDKIFPELHERAVIYRGTRDPHEVDVKMQVVQTNKSQPKNLFGLD
jgi:hypothetical protein